MFTNYCINSIIFMTVFSNTCPSQEVHVSLLAFFFFLTCLGDSQLSSDFVCGGGTLFCLILGLETSVSCSICGTWEAILSESLSDTITDGSVETASEGASSGYLKKIGKKFQEFTKSYNSKTFLYSYFGTILSRCWEDGTEKLSQKNLLKLYSKPQDCDCHLVPKLFSCIQAK